MTFAWWTYLVVELCNELNVAERCSLSSGDGLCPRLMYKRMCFPCMACNYTFLAFVILSLKFSWLWQLSEHLQINHPQKYNFCVSCSLRSFLWSPAKKVAHHCLKTLIRYWIRWNSSHYKKLSRNLCITITYSFRKTWIKLQFTCSCLGIINFLINNNIINTFSCLDVLCGLVRPKVRRA